MVELSLREPLVKICQCDQLMAYHHPEYWQCMDTIRYDEALKGLWAAAKAPWRGLHL